MGNKLSNRLTHWTKATLGR